MNRTAALLVAVIAIILPLNAREAWAKKDPMTPEARERREQMFKLTAESLNFKPSQYLPHVWGTVMERTYPDNVITVYVSLGGNANVYFGAGGKITNAGKAEQVREADGRLLVLSEKMIGKFKPAKDHPLPKEGRVKFYLFTFSGLMAAEAKEKDLLAGKHELAPLYHAFDGVITQIRNVTEKTKADARTAG